LENEEKISVLRFLEKAKSALDDAEFNTENNRYNTALIRIYYSIFYSVMSLGYLDNFITSKHKQLMGWFNKKYIYEEKIFDENLSKIYKEAYENRMESDYETSLLISKEEISANIDKAKVFVNTLLEYIYKKLK
jgi:uncharacterized protein (UPF0332 family)